MIEHVSIPVSNAKKAKKFYKAALKQYGITLKAGRGQVGCVLVGWQQNAYTYPSVTPQQDETGHIKLNLHPDDWRNPDDRARSSTDAS